MLGGQLAAHTRTLLADGGEDREVRQVRQRPRSPNIPGAHPPAGRPLRHVGLLRGGPGVVMPDDRSSNAPWSDRRLDDEEFTRDRAILGLQSGLLIAHGRRRRPHAVPAAAPLMRPSAVRLRPAGHRRQRQGCFTPRPCSVPDRWARRSSFMIFAGIGRSAPSCERGGRCPATQRLLAVDGDAPDPGLGDRLNKAISGERSPSACRLPTARMARSRGRHGHRLQTHALHRLRPGQNRRWRFVNFDRTGSVVR